MTTAEITRPAATDRPAQANWGSIGLWCCLAFAAIAVRGLYLQSGWLTTDLIDSDDALRLVQVRELLAGATWSEVTTNVLGGRNGLTSHWSRLIDLPLAIMIGLLANFIPMATAELVTRAVWPLLVLAPLVMVLARAIEQGRGRATTLVALGLIVLSPTALYQFDPGRIDHHNVMIAGTISALALIWAYPGKVVAYRIAGTLAGLALAVGYEALGPVIAMTSLAGIWALCDRRQAPAVSSYLLALILTLALALAATQSPRHWLISHCDALSANLVVLAAVAGTGVVFVLRYGASLSALAQAAVIAASGGLGLFLFATMNAACLAGPMGEVPRMLGPIWIDLVDEARSPLAPVGATAIASGIGLVVFLAIGLCAQARAAVTSRSGSDWFLLAMAFALSALALWQTKFGPYATLAVIPGLASLISALPARASISAPTIRLAAAVLVSQATLMGAAKLVHAALVPSRPMMAPAETAKAPVVDPRSCLAITALQALDALPPGLFAAHIDIGTHLAANTHHRALAGPYHRMPNAIMSNHDIFAATDVTDAGRIIAREGIEYLLTCHAIDAALARRPDWQGTFRAQLVAGAAPNFLTKVQLARTGPFAVWRVDRSQLPAQ